jgi:hypothetical protein
MIFPTFTIDNYEHQFGKLFFLVSALGTIISYRFMKSRKLDIKKNLKTLLKYNFVISMTPEIGYFYISKFKNDAENKKKQMNNRRNRKFEYAKNNVI